MTTQVRKQTEIQQAVVFRAVDKVTGKTLGYSVKSDSSEKYYQVQFINHKLHCSCPATCECKHIRAIKEVGEARKEMKAEPVSTPALATYDIVGAALAVVNAEIVAQKVGDSYSRDPHIEVSERDAEATRRINFELGMGY